MHCSVFVPPPFPEEKQTKVKLLGGGGGGEGIAWAGIPVLSTAGREFHLFSKKDTKRMILLLQAHKFQSEQIFGHKVANKKHGHCFEKKIVMKT